MSKKIDLIADAVFYAQQDPRKLATIIGGLITDTATSIKIEGVSHMLIPSGDLTSIADYSAYVASQFGDRMEGSVTLSLKASVTGVSISGSTVTVDNTASAGSFTIVATNGTLTAEKEVSLITG